MRVNQAHEPGDEMRDSRKISKENDRKLSSNSIFVASSTLIPGDFEIFDSELHAIAMAPNVHTVVPTSYDGRKMKDYAWPGSTFGYLPPGMKQRGYIHSQAESTAIFFSVDFFKTIARSALKSGTVDMRELVAVDDPVGAHLIRSLGHAAQSGGDEAWPLLIESIATSLAVRLIQNLGGTVLKQDPRSARMDRVHDYINDQSHQRLGLYELADVAGLSIYHFSRQFKKTFGKTPQDYVMGVRVDNAMKLIRGGSVPLSIIAAACGFASQAHMTTVIKERTGLTPGQHRRDEG